MARRSRDLSAQWLLAPPRISTRARVFALTFAVAIAATVVSLSFSGSAMAIAGAGALAIGWSHLAGRCGMAHFGTLTPRGKLPGVRRRWLADVTVYATSGAVATMAIGASLGLLGQLLPAQVRPFALGLVVALAIAAAVSDLGLSPRRLPQPSRQTRKQWARFPPPIPAAMWGVGLGVTVATVFTFSGTWLVLALPIALGDPAVGALLLLAHWVGRALPILAGPLLLHHPACAMDVMDEIEGAKGVFLGSNLVGVGLIAVAVSLTLRATAM